MFLRIDEQMVWNWLEVNPKLRGISAKLTYIYQLVHTGTVYVLLLHCCSVQVVELLNKHLFLAYALPFPMTHLGICFISVCHFSPSQTSLQAREIAFHIVAACKWHFTTPLIFAKFTSSCFCFKLFWGKCVDEGPTCICRISFWIKCQIQIVGTRLHLLSLE